MDKIDLEWVYEIDNVDWDKLSNLYKIAPLGDKKPQDLKTVFTNSRYRCFVYDEEKIVGVCRVFAKRLGIIKDVFH